jgi:hypothetical protein
MAGSQQEVTVVSTCLSEFSVSSTSKARLHSCTALALYYSIVRKEKKIGPPDGVNLKSAGRSLARRSPSTIIYSIIIDLGFLFGGGRAKGGEMRPTV